MSLIGWLRTLERRIFAKPARGAPALPVRRWARCAMMVELLEDRIVPAPFTYTWKIANTTGNWDDATNWTSTNGGTTFPVAGDTAIFGGAPTATVNVSLHGAQSAATVTFSNTAQSYVIAPSATTDSLTIGTSLTSTATAALTNAISGAVTISGITATMTTGTLVLAGQATAAGLTEGGGSGTLRLANVSAASPNNVTGTITVNGGILEALNTQAAGTDALGSANVVLNGGTFKPDAVPSFQASAPGVFGKYFNFTFAPANNTNTGTTPTVGQADYSQAPTATRVETGGINFASANPSTFQPTGINATNFGAEWIGGLNILTGGIYTFAVNSDDSAQLFIDGAAVVTNNANANTTSANQYLNAGTHSVEMRFIQVTGGGGAVLSYTGPDTTGTVAIPATSAAGTSGLFQISTATANTFVNNVSVAAGATGTIDVTANVMDTTLGTLTTNANSTLNVLGGNTGRTLNFGGTTLGGASVLSPTGVNVNPGVITGGGFALTKTGAGTLTLNGANSALAGVTGRGGTLVLGNANALGGGTLSVGPLSTTVNLTTAGVLGTSGTVTLTPGENLVAGVDNALTGLTVNVGPGATLQATTANALSGATVNLTGGALILRADTAASFAGTINVANNNSTINVDRLTGTATGVTLSITNLGFTGGATTLNVTGGNTYGLQLTGTLTLAADTTVNTLDANLTVNGAVTGAGKLIKVGTGTMTLTAESPTWSGGAEIRQGTLQANTSLAVGSNSNAFGSSTGSAGGFANVTLNGGTLSLNATNGSAGTLAAYTVPTAAANVNFLVNVVLAPGLGTATINNVTKDVTITGTLTMAPGQVLATTGAAVINFGNTTTAPALALSAGTYTFSPNVATSFLALNGVLSGAGSVNKLGAGNLILGNINNSFTGGVAISAGVLLAEGASAQVTGNTQNTTLGQSAVTLNAGGTLQLQDTGAAVPMFFNNANTVTVTGNATINTNKATTGGTTINLTSVTVGNNTLTLGGVQATASSAIIATLNLTGAATVNASNAGGYTGAYTIGTISDGNQGFSLTKTGAQPLVLTGDSSSTFSGDFRVNQGLLQLNSGARTNSNFFVEPGNVLQLNAAANVAGGKTVTVNSISTTLGVLDVRYDGALPAITGASTGLLALGSGTYSQNINLGTLGNGTFFLGASVNTTLTGTLTPSGTTYRLGGGGFTLTVGGSNVLADNGGATNLVVGTALANGTGNLTNGTGTVVLLNSNTYTGGTLVNRGSTLVIGTGGASTPLGTGGVNVYGTLTAAGANGSFADATGTVNTNAITLQPGSILRFDSTNGFQGLAAGNNNNRWGDTAAIGLNGSTLELIGQNVATSATAEVVGAVSFDKGSVISVRRGNATNTATLTVAGLTRTGRGTLTLVTSTTGTLGTAAAGAEQVVDLGAGTAGDAATTPVAVNVGDTNADTMTAPYIVNGTDNTFVSFGQAGALGFGNTKFSTRALTAVTTAANNDVVNVTAATALTADVLPYAMRVSNVAITGAFNVKLQSGGAISTGSATHASNFAYGPTSNLEGLIYVANGFTIQHTGTDATSAGLTKFGQGLYSLQGANTGLTGGLVNNANSNNGATVGAAAGTLELKANAQAGGATGTPNTVTLNGGTLNLRYDTSTSLPNSVVVPTQTDATISVDRAGTTATNNTLTLAAVTVGNGTLSVSGADGYALTVGGALTLTGNATINTNTAATTTTVNGGVSDGGSGFGYTKIGSNTVVVNGVGTTTGVTNVLAGTLTFGSGVISVAVGNGGSGYTSAPTVAFSAPTGGGVTATGTANISGGAVTSITITNAGSGYTAAPTITLTGGAGTGATATATISNVVIGNATTPGVVDPGATLNLTASTNVASGSKVAVNSNNLTLGVLGIAFNATQTNLTSLITGTSSGVLGVNGTISNNLDLSGIGNGTFFLGSNSGGTYSGTALTPSGSVYRLGGGGNTLTVSNNVVTGANNLVVGVALANGTGALANGGGTVNFQVAQGYTGTTTLTSNVTVGYLNASANNNASSALTQTLPGDIILMGSPTINAGPGGQNYSSIVLTIQGKLNYGGNTVTFQQGVIALTGGAATGTGGTTLAGGGLLHLTNMNQLSSGNLNLNNGAFVLGKDDGTGVAPSWTQFNAKYTGGFGTGPNQWQVSAGGAGFAGKGSPGDTVTILVDNAANSAYGYVTSQTLFDRDFRYGSDKRGNLTGAAGSQVFYANLPVTVAQNTTLSGVRTISVAPTGPGVSGAPGTGVVTRITGNLGGTGAVRFTSFDTPQGPGVNGAGVDEAAEIVLAGANTWTGTPGTIQGINPGGGGLVLDGNTFVRFATSASLPTGNGGAPAFLAAIRDNTTTYAGGFLLTASNATDNSNVYSLPAGYSFVFGDSVPVSGNARVSVLGSTSDAGTPGTATLQNANVLILNTTPTGQSAAPLPTDLGQSGAQTLGLLVRDGFLNLGSGSNAVTFQNGNNAYLSNNNFLNPSTDGIAHSLAFGVADTQTSANLRTIEKVGYGTAVVNNVAYAFPAAGTDSSANFTWNLGNNAQTAYGGAVRETSETGAGVQNLGNVRVNFTGGVLEITGDFTRGAGTGVGQVNWGTNGGGFAAIGGNRNVNLGGSGAAVSFSQPLFLGSTNTDSTVNFVNPITLTADDTVRTIHGVGTVPEGQLSGAIGGAFNLVYSQVPTLAPGTVVVSGASTYSGLTQLNVGTVIGASNGAFGTASNGTTVLPGALLELQGNITTPEALALNGTGIGGSGALVNLSGTNTVAGQVTLGSASSISSAAGTLSLNGSVVANFGLTVGGAGNVTVNGPLSGASGFVPGLAETVLVGSFDTTTPGFGGAILNTPRMSNISTSPPWAPNMTVVYTGQIFDGDGTFAFAEDFDDNVRVQVDGVTRLSNTTFNVITNTASTTGVNEGASTTVANANTGSATTTFGQGPAGDGWHNIDLRFGNAGGGGGMRPTDTTNHWGTSATVPKGFGYATSVPTSGGTNPAYDGNNYNIPTGGTAAVDGNVRYLASNSLTKTGTGTLTLTSNLNSYAGGTTISGGAVVATVPGALGSGTVTLDGGNLTTGAPAPSDPTTVTGFGVTGTGWTLNGGATVAADVATLTDGAGNEARSVFFNTPVPTTNPFTARFTYTAGGNRAADGVAFVLQNAPQGAAALGGGGGAKGYGGIAKSAAVLFNIFTGGTPAGVIGSALTAGGANPADSTFISSSPVNIASGNPINVTVVYNPVTQTLTVTLVEQGTTNTSSVSLSGVNLATLVSGNSAFVGFTGATGGANAVQTISNFSFTESLLTPAAYPNNVVVNPGKAGAINVLAPNAPALNAVSLGTLTLGGGSSLTVGADAGTPANQPYSLAFGTTTLTGPGGTLAVNNNGTGAGTVTVGAVGEASGPAALTKGGTGTLVLTAAGTYTGATNVLNGTLQLAGVANTLPTGTTVTLGDGAANTSGTLDLNNLNQQVAGLLTAGSGTANSVIDSTNETTTPTLTVNVASGTDVYGGNLGGASANGFLVTKTGAGTLDLTGTGTYTGATAVNAGTLLVDGSLTASAVTVANGATLGGSGTITGTVTAATGATLAPGHSPGVLNTGDLTLSSGSTFAAEIGGTAAGNGTGFYDQDNVTGAVSLGGATLNLSLFGGFTPHAHDQYVLINNDGTDPIPDTFNGLAEGALITNFLGTDLTAVISYKGIDGTGNDVVLTLDHPPVIDSVTITPASPFTNDLLTANVLSHDPDGDTVSYTYQWLNNGVAIPGATLSTLDLSQPGNGDKDQHISVLVTPSDGILTGNPVSSAFVTIQNSPPTATVSLNSHAPLTNDTLTATATEADADGDPVSLTFVWTVNGVPRRTFSSATALTDTFDLSVAGNGDKGQTVTVTVTPNDGTVDGAAASDSALVADSAPSATVVLDNHSPLPGDTLTATATKADADGDAVTLTFVWKVNNVTKRTFTSATALTDSFPLTPGLASHGDLVTVLVTPNDGFVDGTTASDTATVVDIPPTATVTLDNHSPLTNDVLTATATKADFENDPVTLTFVWTVNGTVRRTFSSATALTDTFDLGPAGNGDKGQTVTVTVTPNDTFVDGTAASDSATVINSAPTATVSLNTPSPLTGDTLTATATKADPDGDPVTLTFVWTVNGVPQRTFSSATALTDTFNLTSGVIKHGDVVSVTVTPNDGFLTGAAASDSATVADTAPTATVSLNTHSPLTGDTLTATATKADADGEPVSLTFVWKVNGTIQRTITSATALTDTFNLTSGVIKHGDVVSVTVTPNDGFLDGAAASASLTVADTAPTATVSLNNHSPQTKDTLTATATKADADGEPVSLTFVWKVNGTTRRTFTSATALTDSFDLSVAGNGDKGQTVTVSVTPDDGTVNGAAASDSAAVIDTPPVVNTVTFSPSAPLTNDVLTAVVTSHDDDGESVTYSYLWFKNGTAIAGATGASLDLSQPGNGDASDAITVQVTPTAAGVNGTAVTAGVTVGHTPPTIDLVTVTPTIPKTDDTLTTAVTSHDIDGDPVSYTYQWFNNGGAIAGATDPTLDLSQPGHGDKGDHVTVQVTAHAAGNAGAPFTALVIVGDSAPVIDLITISPSAPLTDDVLTAMVTAHDPDGDPISYSYQWYKNGVALTGATGATLDLSQPGNGDKDDQLAVWVRPTAAGVNGDPVTSIAVTVGHALPVIDSVTVTPANPLPTDTLTTAVVSHDDSGDPVTYTYQWLKNDNPIPGATGATLALGGIGKKGDRIVVQVTPIAAGTITGFAVRSTAAIVGDTAPVIDSVTVTPTNPRTRDTLTATPASHDADGDPVTYSYQWLKNGSPIAGATGATLDLGQPGNGNRGDHIAVRVTPNDGTLDGAAVTSAAVTVLDSAPVVDSVTIMLNSPNPADKLTAVVTSHDDDGDPVIYSYRWLKNGSPIAGANGPTLDLSQPGNGGLGDSIAVQVTPTDGTLAGTAVTSVPVTVGAFPTTTVLSSTNTNAAYGEAIIRATVTPTTPGVGTPPGSVTFVVDDGTSTRAIPVALVGNTATLNVPLDAGSYTITASYAGDPNFGGSASQPLAQVVNPAATATLVSSTPGATSGLGDPVTFIARVAAVAPGSGTPTGSVTFTVDGHATTVPLDGTGTATLAAPALSVGSHTVTAAYGVSRDFQASTSAVYTQVVGQARIVTGLTVSAADIFLGQPLTMTATVTSSASGVGVPSGSVTFFIDGTTPLGTVGLVNGQASLSVGGVALGSHVISAVYSGDGTFAPSSAITQVNNLGVPIRAVAGRFRQRPTVNVFDTSGALLFRIFPYGKSFHGRVRVTLADMNGDGFPDIVVTRAGAKGRFKVFNGHTGAPM
jgi:autotransporter-associated beta strand protein